MHHRGLLRWGDRRLGCLSLSAARKQQPTSLPPHTSLHQETMVLRGFSNSFIHIVENNCGIAFNMYCSFNIKELLLSVEHCCSISWQSGIVDIQSFATVHRSKLARVVESITVCCLHGSVLWRVLEWGVLNSAQRSELQFSVTISSEGLLSCHCEDADGYTGKKLGLVKKNRLLVCVL
jgi:hypothetical protein